MSTAARERMGELGVAAMASPDGLVLLSPSWTLQSANPAAIDLLGGGDLLARGKAFPACVPAGERVACEDWLLRLGTGERVAPLRLEWPARPDPVLSDGPRAAAVAALALVVTGRALPAGGFCLCLRPASEVPPLDPTLLQSERMRSLGGLVAGIAHEINNPLTGILGFAEMLARGAVDPGVKADLRRIHESAARCHAVVRDLLAFAQPGERETAGVDLSQTLDGVLRLQEYHWRSRGIALTRRFAPGCPPCRADRRMLEHALLAVLQNAIEAAGDGGRLRVTVEPAGDRVTCEIADNGPGIPPEVLPRVFDPFFTTRPEGGGRGLGLTLAQANIDAMGGWIRIRSLVGVGTRVRLALPAAGPAVEPAPAAPPPALPAPARDRRPRVLVVDDEPHIRALVERLLTADGCDVLQAEHGLDALRRLTEGPVDCILADLRMPVCSGPELHAVLQARHPELALRTIFLTGDVLSPEIAAFLASRPGPVLHKPFDCEALRTAVAPFVAACGGR